MRSAAAWADGVAGTTLDLDVDKQNELFDIARTAWAQAGKPSLGWPRHSGSRLARPTRRGRRFTGICAVT